MSRQPLHRINHAEAVAIGEVQVQQHKVETVARDEVDRLGGRPDAGYRMAGVGQHVPDQARDSPLVFG
ncbi:MAG: hypothetical protein C0506_06070 [Anaerolinea sp.]|nr:hypothetical protein [Anaerolinea sp.]